ncbi:MAG TPA: FtsX-like permease family protein [Longimicrobiaceae bacterium]|nr:FtsX-like permease family protein [Longimicrobiaceae bacterium]
MGLEWFIGRRYLSSRRGTRFLSLITLIAIGGVTVGVMALIVVIAVMTGLQRDLREKILGLNPHVWVLTYGEAMRMEDWAQALRQVRRVPGVVAAGPFVHTEVGVTNRSGYSEAAVLRGVELSGQGRLVTDLGEQLRTERVFARPTRSGLPPVVLGNQLAERSSILPGDTITVVGFQGATLTATGFVPKLRHFEVAGTFHTGMYEYDNKFMYTTVAAAQELTGLGNAVSGLEVRVPDPLQATAVARRIDEALGLPYRTDDWKRMNGALFSALKLEKLAMGIILLLIVVVAAFNIVSTLVMVVADKTREIGILKSMGLSSRKVLRIFMLQGLVIGGVGCLLGGLGGAALVWVIDYFELIKIPGDIYFVNHLPVAFDPLDVVVILVATVLISFLATIYPARQAARLTPVDAIRHE